ncbi:MAG: hypothetical protein ACK41D_02930 [Rubricoccaceae bacterium]
MRLLALPMLALPLLALLALLSPALFAPVRAQAVAAGAPVAASARADSALIIVEHGLAAREAPARALYVNGTRVPLAGESAGSDALRLRRPPGTYGLTLVENDLEWQPRRLEQTVTVAAGDSVVVRFGPFPPRYRLDSWPTGAALALVGPDGAETPLGTAPVVLDAAAPLAGTLVARLEGFAEARAPAPPAQDPRATLVLRPLARSSYDGAPAAARLTLPTARRDTRRRVIDLGLGAAALGATALAVHWKFRADALDTAYRDPLSSQRGDEALRQEALRYDVYSGLALGAGSAALGGLALRLVLR